MVKKTIMSPRTCKKKNFSTSLHLNWRPMFCTKEVLKVVLHLCNLHLFLCSCNHFLFFCPFSFRFFTFSRVASPQKGAFLCWKKCPSTTRSVCFMLENAREEKMQGSCSNYLKLPLNSVLLVKALKGCKVLLSEFLTRLTPDPTICK